MCARTLCMRARVDIVATKLGTLHLLPSFFLLLFFHLLFSQKGFAYDFEFLHAFLSNKLSFLGGQQAECVRYG